MKKIDELKEKFKNPTASYRSAPFWSWNDDLKAEELSWQVKEMKDKGMGGFFMHSREGLETEYMGEEWMKCIKSTVDTAKKEGMNAWLYDEDRWPSGFAGGLVAAKGGDAFRSKGFTMEILRGSYKFDEKVLAIFEADIEENSINECRSLDISADYVSDKNKVLLVFRREISGYDEWFNDDAYADNLSPDSVAAFIETTYEKYKEGVGEEFGKTVPGIFTDEPNISGGGYTEGRAWIPWTDGFEEYFLKKRGYSFLQYAPYIFFEGEKSSKTRHDYWRTISDRFSEAYSKQLGQWCEENNLAFTGHFLTENNFGEAARTAGSVMPLYRYQHVPGIDMLREATSEFLTVKQCTSVANQYNRERVLSETYGCTGWDFSFEGQKWVGDWQYVMGVNLRCQHLALYSLKGCRKRDYPPVFNYNTSWWKYNKVVEDYFARIATITTVGEVMRDVLVIHPMSTVWTSLGCSPDGIWMGEDRNVIEMNKYSVRFNEFLKIVLATHYDFDLGDETIIEEMGRVEGSKLVINQAEYSVVIIPDLKTLFGSTLKLLEQFLNAGGKVIAVEPLPTMIEGQLSRNIDSLFQNKNIKIVKEYSEIETILENLIPRKVSIENKYQAQDPSLLYMLRDMKDSKSLFVVNNDRNNSHIVDIKLAFRGRVEEWNLLTGEIKEIGINVIDECTITFEASFGPCGSKMFMLIEEESKTKLSDKKYLHSNITWYHHPHDAQQLCGTLGPVGKFTRTMPNSLILDKCCYKMENGNWSEEMDVWQAQKEVRTSLGMRQIYYNGLPQRYKWVNESHAKDGAKVEFKFNFNVVDVPEKETFLVVECVKNYEISFNGKSLNNKSAGWFMDKSFDKISLPELKKGVNEMTLSCNYLNKMEVEDCYIIGDFGVDVNRNIVKEPETLHFGDWCMQGYFHYCGSIVYHFDFDYVTKKEAKAILELGEYSAITVEVRVNGNSIHIPWRDANAIDIAKFLKQGGNNIDIEVMGSPRNLFGPFHRASTNRASWTSWESFRTEGVEYTPQYVVKPYGLMGQINIF